MTSVTLEIDGELVTYEKARNKNENFVHEWTWVQATKKLCATLWENRDAISALTRHHLRLGYQDSCAVVPTEQWSRGSFNVCVPVEVSSASFRGRVMFRCPMPHKLAEATYPGTVDEKMGCEVGTYAWMQDWCSDVRIPHLYGFGFADHRHFTHEEQRPLYIRLVRAFQRYFNRHFGYPTLSRYTLNPTTYRLPTAYMILEHIDSNMGQLLSHSWDMHRRDPSYRRRLFQGMAHLILSLARVPQPRIGSYQFNNDCTITLTNRPLSCSMMILENDGAPRTVERSDTYTCTDAFVTDALSFHDHYFLSNPNAVIDEGDCRGQMAVKTLLRALSHKYIRRECRSGPFVLQFTDFHASNIFVDKDWNITCLIDLEWVCSLPREMLAVPYWLSGRGIDQLVGEGLTEFNEIREEFMTILEEQHKATGELGPSLVGVMGLMWESGGVWFWHCVRSVNAMLYVFDDHISPRFLELRPSVEGVLSKFWSENSDEVVESKIADLKLYENELGRLFGERR
ncbi:Uncharacterized protein TPAR_07412 [Tolypocladium paradoxum]|uniref:Aminoglycoside phosphotransferase domain-containing protein n=1 Tax=Tolypocladium paradoxum TaxID=94208 RepID=A0A2S4KQA6_9HYPO|nr:Uncharacterized protein TPAR_07412 [Tolypocladium paradoxum]